MRTQQTCPVCCSHTGQRLILESPSQTYFACATCQARYLNPADRPTATEERRQYELHRNSPDDVGYRNFLSRLATPLLERLPAHKDGLDYGAGPGPTLSVMLEEAGHRMRIYDPIFAPDRSVLATTYDFVTCTETAEHFHDPAKEFRTLDALLRPNGLLAVMTCFQTDDDRFANWHYRKDPTHVVFYRADTFRWLADAFGWHCDIPQKDVVFLRKGSA